MGNNLQIFNNTSFGEVRSIEIDGKVYFVASDIAKALGYERPNDAINQHCRYTVKYSIPHPQSSTKTIDVNVISDSDVYRLIAHSKLPRAVEFEKWLFEEVIPSIHKTGAYGFENLTRRQIFELGLKAEIELEEANKKLIEAQPKIDGFNTFLDTTELTSIEIFAKNTKPEFGLGRNNMFDKLRELKIIEKNKPIPYQQYIDDGYFLVKETPLQRGKLNKSFPQSFLTKKGVEWLYNKLKKELIK